MPHTTVSRLLAGTPFLTLDLLLLAGILMVLFRRREVFSQNRDPLAPEHSTAIRGLLAVTVVLHHLSLTVTHANLFRIFTLAGIVCVSVFFFYSGYGLMVGLLKKADYLRGFFSRRVLRIAFFYLLSNLVIWYGFQLTHYKYTLSEIQHGLVTGDPFTPYSWYVLTLLILYVLFYICARLFHYLSLPEPLFSFLGKISFEIYLYHGLVMRLVRSKVFYLSSDLLYLMAVFAITIPLAWVMHRLGEFLWQVLTRRSWRRVAAVSNT